MGVGRELGPGPGGYQPGGRGHRAGVPANLRAVGADAAREGAAAGDTESGGAGGAARVATTHHRPVLILMMSYSAD